MVNMKEILKMMKWKVKVKWIGVMVIDMKEIFKKDINKEKE